MMDAAAVAARHTPEAIAEEIGIFEEKIGQFERREISEDDFRRFRLKHGIYGQRQPGVQMVRVKCPSGVLTTDALRCLGSIARDFGTPQRGHVTTRENVQFHFVQLRNVPEIMRRIAKVDLTTREACGNTIRNITACPLAGVCGDEAFDVTPYALATTRFFLRHPEFHELPRKFKIAFSGCEDDGNCAVAAIHDVGLIARVRDGKRGFKVVVGGGLGSLPTEAATLSEFLPVEELLPTIEAVLRVFNEFGNRKNKMMARMKFVLRAKGIEEFKRLVAEKRPLSTAPVQEDTWATPIKQSLVHIDPAPAHLDGAAADYERWMKHNFRPQPQPGYAVAWIKLTSGNVSAEQFHALGDLLDKLGLPGARIAISQDLVIPWVPVHLSRALYLGLRQMDLADPGARTIADVTGCPGATTCNLGITRSLTLSEVLANEFAGETDPLVQQIRIKISGCPNSCGQHHIADLGLYGNARKVGPKQAPYYQLMIGGRVNGSAHFGRQLLPIPARRVPQVFRAVIELYKSQRQPGETFLNWADRTPDETLVAALAPHAKADASESDLYVDWGDTETYSLKLGRGECAA